MGYEFMISDIVTVLDVFTEKLINIFRIPIEFTFRGCILANAPGAT